MGEWRTESLLDCLAALIDYRGKSPPKSASGIPVLSAKVVKTTGLLRPIEQMIAPEYYPQWMTRGLPRPGDVVMTTEGPMGQVIQLDEESAQFALGQRIVCMRGKDQKLDNTYLRYLLTSPMQQEILRSYATGTTVLGISQKALRSMPISVPDFLEQKRIGQVLAALDSKIDLNRRMNATLGAIAQAIFKDWFIDFGPTRAKANGHSAYLAPELWGLFPDAFDEQDKPIGWSNRSVYEFADVIYGAPFSSKQFNAEDEGVPLIRIRDLASHKPGVSTVQVHKKGHMIEAGDIIVGMDGEFRLHIWKGPRAWLNQRVCHFQPKAGVPKAYLAEALKEPLAFFERGKVGTTVIHLGKSDIDTFKLICPGERLLDAFARVAEPLVEATVSNAQQSRTLAQTRDLLLPKLMSGEICLAEAEKGLEAVA